MILGAYPIPGGLTGGLPIEATASIIFCVGHMIVT